MWEELNEMNTVKNNEEVKDTECVDSEIISESVEDNSSESSVENDNSEYVEAGEIERPVSEPISENVDESSDNDNNSGESEEDKKKETLPISQLQDFLRMVSSTIKQMESKWRMVSSQLKLTQPIIKKIYTYNNEHAIPLPEEATAEAHVQYDHFNGLDNITLNELKEILGPDHQLVHGNLKDNIEMIKNAMGLFINWLASLKEYKSAYKEYQEILDAEQYKNIEVLKNILESDPENPDREKIEAALNSYYDNLYLNFLSTPLSDEVIARLINVFNDKEKFDYWENRAAAKLKQIGVVPLTIVELASFEKKYLDEKYHKCSNMLALYVMNLARYARNDDKSPNNMKRKILLITSTLHKFIEGNMKDEQKEKVLENVKAFLDQFLDKDISDHTELFENYVKNN